MHVKRPRLPRKSSKKKKSSNLKKRTAEYILNTQKVKISLQLVVLGMVLTFTFFFFLFSSRDHRENVLTQKIPHFSSQERFVESDFSVERANHFLKEKLRIGHLGDFFYGLKEMASLGEFELSSYEIHLIAQLIKKGKSHHEKNWWDSFLQQCEKVKFGNRRGKYFVKIFTKKKKKIPLSFGSYPHQFNLVIHDGAELRLAEMNSSQVKSEIVEALKHKKYSFVWEGSKFFVPIGNNSGHDFYKKIDRFVLANESEHKPIVISFSGIEKRESLTFWGKQTSRTLMKGLCFPEENKNYKKQNSLVFKEN